MTTSANDLKAASPLSIPREELITILQEKLKEMQALRDVGQEESKTLNAPINEAIAAFSPDEMLAIFQEYFTINVAHLADYKRTKRFVPEAEKVPAEEERLGNVIGLLQASTDPKIELDSSSEIYNTAVHAVKALGLRGF